MLRSSLDDICLPEAFRLVGMRRNVTVPLPAFCFDSGYLPFQIYFLRKLIYFLRKLILLISIYTKLIRFRHMFVKRFRRNWILHLQGMCNKIAGKRRIGIPFNYSKGLLVSEWTEQKLEYKHEQESLCTCNQEIKQ